MVVLKMIFTFVVAFGGCLCVCDGGSFVWVPNNGKD